jgi:hypothetical protein
MHRRLIYRCIDMSVQCTDLLIGASILSVRCTDVVVDALIMSSVHHRSVSWCTDPIVDAPLR